MITILAIVVLAFPVMRGYSRRLERTRLDSTEKVHRLRRGLAVYALLSGVAGAVGAAELRGEFGSIGTGRALLIVFPAVFLTTIGSLTGAYLGIRPAYERLRGIEDTGAQAPRRFVRLIVALLLPQAVWLSLFVLLRHRIPGAALLALALGYLLLMAVSGPLLVIAAMPTRAADPVTRERAMRLCHEHGVRINNVRIIETKHDPTANAAFAGFGIGPKYMFLTDRLLDQFSDDEVTAVMAHEIAHRKKHHILLKLVTVIVMIVVTSLSLALLAALLHGRVAGMALAITLPVLVFGTILIVNGLVGIGLERQADDYASAVAGPDATRRMLEKLAELNMLKRRTGWLWNALQQHPGIQQRLNRVAARSIPESARAGSSQQRA
jgi:Zn-dependent protease with chaperone function